MYRSKIIPDMSNGYISLTDLVHRFMELLNYSIHVRGCQRGTSGNFVLCLYMIETVTEKIRLLFLILSFTGVCKKQAKLKIMNHAYKIHTNLTMWALGLISIEDK